MLVDTRIPDPAGVVISGVRGLENRVREIADLNASNVHRRHIEQSLSVIRSLQGRVVAVSDLDTPGGSRLRRSEQ